MTKANPVNYEIAADLIETAQWRADPVVGLVYGKRGNSFRRTNSWGYVQIKFRDPSDWHVEHAALAHRVIWEVVHGPLDLALTINHLNGDKQDNRIENLEAITQADNVRHAFATGLNAGRAWTHCKAGHEFTGANTRYNVRGGRACRACDRQRAQQYRSTATAARTGGG